MDKNHFTGAVGTAGVGASSLALGQGGFESWEVGSISFLALTTAGAFAYLSRHRIIDRVAGDDLMEVQRAELRDTKHIHDLARTHLGQNITSCSQIKALIRRNRDIFWVILANDHRRHLTKLCGYFCLIPLSRTLMQRADGGELNILAAAMEDVPTSFAEAEAVYFGGIVSATYSARGKLLGCAEEKAKQLAMLTRTRKVYARAGTERGLTLIRDREFAPVVPSQSGLSALFVRQLEPDALLTQGSRRSAQQEMPLL